MLTGLLLLVRLALAGCPAAAEDVRAGTADAYAAYAALDVDAFGGKAASTIEAAGCLQGPISPQDVARLHLVTALRAWVGRDGPGLLAGLQGVRAADPSATLDAEIAPPGGRVRGFWDSAGEGGGKVVPLPTANGVRWRVDGRESDLPVLPLERAVLVQRLDAAGAQVGVWYFPRGGSLATVAPEAVAPLPVETVAAAPLPSPPREPLLRPTSRKLALGSVLAAGAGAAGLVVAVQARDDYRAAPLSAGPLDDLDERNRVAGIAGWSAVGVSGALLGAAVVVHRW